MAFRVDINEQLRKHGIQPIEDALVTGGRIITVQKLSINDHVIIAGFTITFDNYDMVTFAHADLQYCDHPPKEDDEEKCERVKISPILMNCCKDMIQTKIKRGKSRMPNSDKM